MNLGDRETVARHYGNNSHNFIVSPEEEKSQNPVVNAMLLNEFLKEHRTVKEQGATIAELKKEIVDLAETVKEQATQIQKVSAQREASNPSPQVVSNQ